MRNVFSAISVITSAFLTTNAFAADNMGMKMSPPAPMATSAAYTFELAAPVKSEAGKSIVSVRIVHDKMPVTGAVIIQSRADMGPVGMAAMNAPIKAMPVTTPGIYPFEIANGPMWKKADKWALTFAAKVQGQTETIHGSVVVELKP